MRWCDVLELLHESWELEDGGEAAVRTTEGVLSFCVRWSSLCFSASLAVMDTAQGEHTWVRFSLYPSCLVPKWEIKVLGDCTFLDLKGHNGHFMFWGMSM